MRRSRTRHHRIYKVYRKVRYLAGRGTLFTFSRRQGAVNFRIPEGTFRIMTLNSLVLFLLAYLVIYSLTLFATGYAALLFNIPVKLYYYDVDYLIRGIDWTSDSVSGVFSSGPIAMLVLSIFMIILFKAVETERGILRLLLFWIIFHALTRFFGEILVGAILNKGFGFVILYMFLMDTGKVVLTITSFVAMFTAGLLMTRFALYTSNTYFNDLLRPYRGKFLFCQLLLPFLAGNLIISMIKSPVINTFDIFLNLSAGIFLAAVIVRSIATEDLYFDQEERKAKPVWTLTGITLLAAILFRVVFGIGIRL